MHKFRVHHILCTNLYRGMGYDGAFCENMTAVVEGLREDSSEQLLLVTEPDMICANCPNLLPGDRCSDETNHVKIKDQALLAPLHLTEGRLYSYETLMAHASKYLTEALFLDSCSNCQWYREGICQYQNFNFSKYAAK